MIHHVNNDILALTTEIIVHGCNARGVMGAGFAAQVKKKWPSVFQVYVKKYASADGLRIGDIIAIGGVDVGRNGLVARHLAAISKELPPNLIVVNAITQESFGRDGNRRYVDYDAVSACFARIKLLAQDAKMAVHFPLVGCGHANGEWSEVGPRIETALGPDIPANLWTLSAKSETEAPQTRLVF
ncbi:MAG: macro domain-containing protein [Agitococcus sp.]|nr:macro domain-containing protein [Agitococcus sp.]MDO9179102.1 macro domain-containing protein [Agitococcus sp.]